MTAQATIIDAGVGNLGNLRRALQHVGAECRITVDPEEVRQSRCLLLPGVGAFKPPRERLRGGLEDALQEALKEGAWLLGICIGYQLLFASSDEFGDTDGLGLLPGTVSHLPEGVSLPHIGWNQLLRSPNADNGGLGHLLNGVDEGSHVYFVHSYAPMDVPEEVRLADARHGARFTAVAGQGRVLGTQFHPEKSGRTGLKILSNYLELAHANHSGD